MKKEKKELPTIIKVLLFAQALLTFFILILLFVSIGVPEIMTIVNVLIIILFLAMALNNHLLYKRKGFTLFNIIIAILLLLRLLIL